MNSMQRGFALIFKLLIVAVIIGIVAAAVFLFYKNNTLKPKFSEVVNALAPYKFAIEQCAKDGSCVVAGALGGLGVGKLGVPPSISTTYMASVAVAANGTITATAATEGGLVGETFVLTPSYVAGAPITWAVSGTCKTRIAGAIC